MYNMYVCLYQSSYFETAKKYKRWAGGLEEGWLDDPFRTTPRHTITIPITNTSAFMPNLAAKENSGEAKKVLCTASSHHPGLHTHAKR